MSVRVCVFMRSSACVFPETPHLCQFECFCLARVNISVRPEECSMCLIYAFAEKKVVCVFII